MKKIVLLVLLLLIGLGSKAQTSHTYFDHIGVKEGLPESSSRAIVENDGYIWIATQNGLVRYDGYQYKIYPLGDNRTNLLPTNNIESIITDYHNDIWVTVIGNGLFHYDKSTDSFQQFAYTKGRVVPVFQAQTADNSGNIWGVYLTDTKSVGRFDVKTHRFDFFGKKEKGVYYLNASTFYAVQKTADGHIWFPTNNGLYRYNGENKPLTAYFANDDTAKQRGINPLYEAASEPGILWMNTFHGNNYDLRITRLDIRTGAIRDYKRSNKPDSAISAGINSIYEDKSKILWFATDTGLTKFTRQTGKFTNYTLKDTFKNPEKNNLTVFRETKKGKFWLSSPGGLVYFDPANGHFERAMENGEQGALSSVPIIVKMLDHTDRLWVATAFGGINKQDNVKSALEIVKNIPGVPNDYPGPFVKIISVEKGFTWVLTSSGVYNWISGTNKFKKIYALPPGSSAIIGKDSTLYIGNGGGLTVYNLLSHKKDVYKSILADSTTLISNHVGQLFRDHTGIIWIASNDDKGINSFDPKTKKITRYPYLPTLANHLNTKGGALDDCRVLAIYEDRSNTVWVGTNNGGLNRFDRKTGKFVSYYNERNKALYCVNTIFEDRKRRLWLGTYLDGLFEFDRKTGTVVKHVDMNSGLLANSVDNIVEDAAGHLWIESQRGLSRLDPETMKVKNFKINDILPGNEAFGINEIPLNDGRFVITEKNALAIFNPKDLDDNPYPPIVHIESLIHYNPKTDDKNGVKIIAYGRNALDLPYNQNRVQFSFIALHYDDPQQNTYAYKLDGYDKQWVQAGTDRWATYTNLSPGTYTFHVRAANSSGVWNNTGDSFTIVIHPPWWLTWWAWLLWIAAFIIALSSFIKYRSRQLLRENQVLEEKIGYRTQQLSQANKELHEQREEITTQRDQLSETLNELKNTQQQLIQSEKLASLGELTAGIAHEIQNPLNFVNNFSEVNVEMIDELDTELTNGNLDEARAIAADIKQNEEKIRQHGKRADAIVKNMLQHSRQNSGEKELTDINALTDECLRLSYRGLRAKDKSFNADLITELNPQLPKVAVSSQDIGRVLLNLFNNAFYALSQKQKITGTTYKPELTVATGIAGEFIVITIKDNGTGITAAVKDKIMQPFFTTKPTGEGTGLGLSLSYDIVVKGHRGKIEVQSIEGAYSEFKVLLPVG